MDLFRFEIFSEFNSLLNCPEKKEIYCDLDIRLNGRIVQSTSKIVVYLLHPYLKNSLVAADCIILTAPESVLCHKEANRPLLDSQEDVSAPFDELMELTNECEDRKEESIVLVHKTVPNLCEFCSSQFKSDKGSGQIKLTPDTPHAPPHSKWLYTFWHYLTTFLRL